MGMASLYMSILMARIVPADLRNVLGSSLGGVCISLYSFKMSLHMDLMWLCLVSVRLMIVGLLSVLRMRWRSNMVLCIPLVLNVTAFMAGCL